MVVWGWVRSIPPNDTKNVVLNLVYQSSEEYKNQESLYNMFLVTSHDVALLPLIVFKTWVGTKTQLWYYNYNVDLFLSRDNTMLQNNYNCYSYH